MRFDRTVFMSLIAMAILIVPPVELAPGVPPGAGVRLIVENTGLRTPFIENRGQMDERVRYYLPVRGGAVFLTAGGEIVYQLRAPRENGEGSLVLRESFAGGRPGTIRGIEPAETRVSCFHGGDRSRWRGGIPSFHAVEMGEVFDGVRVRLAARGTTAEKLFTVRPGGDPSEIRIRIEGSGGLRVLPSGELEAATPCGPVRFSAPAAWQEGEEGREEVPVAYALRGPAEYGFLPGAFDRDRPLFIDPLLAGTFLGARSAEVIAAVARDPSGRIYVAGTTNSNQFPATPGAYQSGRAGSDDLFVSLFDAGLTTLIASTFLGGAGADGCGRGLVVLGEGEDLRVALCGVTESADFPVTAGAADSLHGGGWDACAAVLSGDLSSLLASTYLGGSADEGSVSIDADGAGNLYVGGATGSSDFPATPSAYDTAYAGGAGATEGGDFFVTKLSGGLTEILASTFVGGAGYEAARRLRVDAVGDPWMCGLSASADFPVTPGAYDSIMDGGHVYGGDACLFRLDGTLETLAASTFLGGERDDWGIDIAFTGEGGVFLYGSFSSAGFPHTPGAADTVYAPAGDESDAFVARFDGDLASLVACTYFGGGAADWANALLYDGAGRIFLAGPTRSTDLAVAPGAYDPDYNGHDAYFVGDVFLARLRADLTARDACTYLGGSRDEWPLDMIRDGSGNILVAGLTQSGDFPFTPGAYDTSFNGSGNEDGFLCLFDSLFLSDAVSVGGGGAAPVRIRLGPNRPNPFNPVTTIRFLLPRRADAELSVYDAAGRRVRALVRGGRDAGEHLAVWDGRDDAGRPVGPGVYFCRLRAGGEERRRKMVLLK